MKVRYIGTRYSYAFKPDKAYEVISIERGWYRIKPEVFEEDYLFPPKAFEIVDESDNDNTDSAIASDKDIPEPEPHNK